LVPSARCSDAWKCRQIVFYYLLTPALRDAAITGIRVSCITYVLTLLHSKTQFPRLGWYVQWTSSNKDIGQKDSSLTAIVCRLVVPCLSGNLTKDRCRLCPTKHCTVFLCLVCDRSDASVQSTTAYKTSRFLLETTRGLLGLTS